MADGIGWLLFVALFGWGFWHFGGDIARDHWHFVGHREPGVCCGERCPHHRPGCNCEEAGRG